ncbi:MAG: cyclic nucleotide-binding domain-containing protein [Planctomycetes bacterium]|nr:cyclic nucleotide-binding domain-containing protein [Planctomycetota bacterium]
MSNEPVVPNTAAVGTSPEPAPIEQRLEYGEPLTPDQVFAIPQFEGFSRGKLEKNPGTIVRRVFEPGELLCREGEFGSTAFLIESGTAEVYLQAQMGAVKKQRRGGFFHRLKQVLTRTPEPERGAAPRRFIPIDAPIDLDQDRPIAELGVGDLFGEMACLSFYPRSATVRAKTRVVVIEMLRNILIELQKNAKFRAVLEEKYRARALDQHLAGVPLLQGLSREFVDQLRPKVKLLRFDPGQPIFKEGDAADGFFLVRIGFVKVAKQWPGGEMILSYLPRGSCFGEMALLSNAPRTASCSALDHVEVVKVESSDFEAMVAQFPEVRARLETLAAERAAQNATLAQRGVSVDLEQFLSQGLMQAQNLLLLDLDRCTRCDECVHGCANAHGGVTRLIRDGLRFDNYLVATTCRTCRDPLCMVGCPVGSIRRKESLEIVIEDWCIGCSLCAKQCPYGNISMVDLASGNNAAASGAPAHASASATAQPSGVTSSRAVAKPKSKATTCDLCMDHGEPACVASCPHDAAHRVDPLKFFEERLFTLQKSGSPSIAPPPSPGPR